jgi:hypothetical protein
MIHAVNLYLHTVITIFPSFSGFSGKASIIIVDDFTNLESFIFTRHQALVEVNALLLPESLKVLDLSGCKLTTGEDPRIQRMLSLQLMDLRSLQFLHLEFADVPLLDTSFLTALTGLTHLSITSDTAFSLPSLPRIQSLHIDILQN